MSQHPPPPQESHPHIHNSDSANNNPNNDLPSPPPPVVSRQQCCSPTIKEFSVPPQNFSTPPHSYSTPPPHSYSTPPPSISSPHTDAIFFHHQKPGPPQQQTQQPMSLPGFPASTSHILPASLTQTLPTAGHSQILGHGYTQTFAQTLAPGHTQTLPHPRSAHGRGLVHQAASHPGPSTPTSHPPPLIRRGSLYMVSKF